MSWILKLPLLLTHPVWGVFGCENHWEIFTDQPKVWLSWGWESDGRGWCPGFLDGLHKKLVQILAVDASDKNLEYWDNIFWDCLVWDHDHCATITPCLTASKRVNIYKVHLDTCYMFHCERLHCYMVKYNPPALDMTGDSIWESQCLSIKVEILVTCQNRTHFLN